MDLWPVLLFCVKATLWAVALLHVLVRCSEVIDYRSQQILYSIDYCRATKGCQEGTHVMCTHFNPNRTMGPLCTETRNVSITPEYAQLILDLLNVIRGRSALGKTTGLANLTLPRAYGMFRLQWDPEMSTYAQVWANSCILHRDECRATKNFPDPGQVAGVTRFDANWIPINARQLFNYTGFSTEKVKYGIQSMLRSWYRAKEYVHPEDITEHDDVWPKHLGTNVFLQTVLGRVTHVGCGISVFKEYAFDASTEHKVDLTYNVVRIVCNLSSRLLGKPDKNRVYTIDTPNQVGYTVRCGCPIGYDEDDHCLCYESGRKLDVTCKDKQCKPAVVVLPIVTVENVPPSKLEVEVRKDEAKHKNPKVQEHVDNTHLRRHNLRGSIFLKPSVFELPPRKLKTENSVSYPNMDVKTRSDLSNVRKLVDVNKLRSTNFTNPTKIDDFNGFSTTLSSKIPDQSKESPVSNMKKDIIHTDRKIFYDNVTLANAKMDTNNELMNLLNKIEEVSKHAQLAYDKKNTLDQKIQKIYSIFMEKAFMSKNNRNTNEFTHEKKGFLENDWLPIVQYNNNKTEKDQDAAQNKIPASNNQMFEKANENSVKDNLMVHTINSNPLAYKNNNGMLVMRNLHGIRDYTTSKGEETNNFQNENSPLIREDDLLTLEKRQFYQNKLNNLERKLRDFQNQNNRNNMNAEQLRRRVLPGVHELQMKRKRPYFNRFLGFL